MKPINFREIRSEARVEVSARLLAHLIAYATLADQDMVRAVRVAGLNERNRAHTLILSRSMLRAAVRPQEMTA